MDLIASGISGRVICLGIENQLGVNIGSFFFFLRVISLPKMNHARFSSDKMFFLIISQIFLSASLIIRIAQFLIKRKDGISWLIFRLSNTHFNISFFQIQLEYYLLLLLISLFSILCYGIFNNLKTTHLLTLYNTSDTSFTFRFNLSTYKAIPFIPIYPT